MAKPRATKSTSSKTKKTGSTEAQGHTDPKAPLEPGALLAAAKPVLRMLGEDLLARAKASPALTAALQARHAAEHAARRTADAFPVWQENLVDQVAAAWLLSCVFVRTLEDRGLLAERRLAGPGAADSQRIFFELAPSLTERDYLLTVFRELTRFPAARDLFDARHNPVWLLTPSAEAAKALLAMFRSPSADTPAFRFGQADTRFLGDLYQDLNESVQKRYALLQTPHFVESFILDRTLERAIERFGLGETTVIDPTCGSGHFLLGAFERLFQHRQRTAPGVDVRENARLALDAVYGADINPYAVAIARFRLTLAYLDRAGYQRLADAPALPLHLVVADSLLHNVQVEQKSFLELEGQSVAAWGGEPFALEDEAAAREVLHRRYAAVVGNPPYITVKDAVLRERYREMYPSAAGKYSLAAPFAERFFQLARANGAVGMITANSFMKREFGKKLITDVLPRFNLDLIINTSGAYIPGHGTPTVLLFGTASPPEGTDVLSVLAKRGEPTTPQDAEQGLVWRSIADHWQDLGFENDFISVAKVPRETLAKHPWSLGGGGAAELKELLEERAAVRLGSLTKAIGPMVVTGEDELYVAEKSTLERWRIPSTHVRSFAVGEDARDWSVSAGHVLYMYDETGALQVDPAVERHLWPFRSMLCAMPLRRARGTDWREYGVLYRDKLGAKYLLPFAGIATHNHFLLERGANVYKQSAPVIRLPETATEDDHLALLAYLNSSTACFWMKQVFFDKGNRGEGGGTTSESWEKFFEFDGTKLRELPVPSFSPEQRVQAVAFGRRIAELAERRTRLIELRDLFEGAEAEAKLDARVTARLSEVHQLEAEIRAVQEQLDWWMYGCVGLSRAGQGPSLRHDQLEPGARACDALFAEEVAAGAVGRRYFELCRLPSPETLASDAWRRQWGLDPVIAAIRVSPQLRLIETPTFKRTFREGFREAAPRAEATEFVGERVEVLMANSAIPTTRTALLTAVRGTNLSAVMGFAADGGSDALLLGELLAAQAVPHLPALRFRDTGLTKHALWQRTWDLQRREDAGEKVGDIPVPPKYDSTDYRDPIFWRLRGKLDVPKERFISYPGCESDQDNEPVYGWAGWDHLQRAQALAALYLKRKQEEAWPAERLTPMLAGILELLPWIQQWHNEPRDGYRLGDYFDGFLDGELRALGLTRDDLRAWRPVGKKKGKAKASKAKAEVDEEEAAEP